jgi:hypothetical protein
MNKLDSIDMTYAAVVVVLILIAAAAYSVLAVTA